MEKTTSCLYAAFLLILFQPQKASGNAKLEMILISYVNPLGMILDNCCDGSIKDSSGVCVDPCDTQFTICVDRADGDANNLTNCSYGTYNIPSYLNENAINFTIPPLIFDLPSFHPLILIKIAAYDVDDKPVLIDIYAFNFTQSNRYLSSGNATFKPYTIFGINNAFFSNPPWISLQMTSFCVNNWYNTSCDVNCVPADECKSHYSCHPETGAKVCNIGWKGPDHDCTEVDATIVLPSCANATTTCKNGATCYVGVNDQTYCCCMPGYHGNDCGYFSNCSVYPCKNGGSCYSDEANQTSASPFICSCPAGYTGRLCETIVPCTSNKCQNNATCINDYQPSPPTYNCSCVPGPLGERFTGSNCETLIDPCANNPCMNNATCVKDFQTYNYNCSCFQGTTAERYAGKFCDIPVPCVNHNCINDATCIPDFQNNNYTCNCSQDTRYTGQFCDIPIPCVNQTCMNNATCIPDFDNKNYTCNCSQGPDLKWYTGIRCEVQIDPCANLTSGCENNATCLPDVNSGPYNFTCNCSQTESGQRYTGAFCKIPVDPCDNSPCDNNATCVWNLNNTSNSHNCVCPNGYSGQNCELHIDVCANAPCTNNEVCSPIVPTPASGNLFTCSPSPTIGAMPLWEIIVLAVVFGVLLLLIIIAVIMFNVVRTRRRTGKLIINKLKPAELDANPEATEEGPVDIYETPHPTTGAGYLTPTPDPEMQPSSDNTNDESKLE